MGGAVGTNIVAFICKKGMGENLLWWR